MKTLYLSNTSILLYVADVGEVSGPCFAAICKIYVSWASCDCLLPVGEVNFFSHFL